MLNIWNLKKRLNLYYVFNQKISFLNIFWLFLCPNPHSGYRMVLINDHLPQPSAGHDARSHARLTDPVPLSLDCSRRDPRRLCTRIHVVRQGLSLFSLISSLYGSIVFERNPLLGRCWRISSEKTQQEGTRIGKWVVDPWSTYLVFSRGC